MTLTIQITLQSIDDVFSAFDDYAKQVQKGSFVYGEDSNLRKITSNAPIYYYGFEENDDFMATDIIHVQPRGLTSR